MKLFKKIITFLFILQSTLIYSSHVPGLNLSYQCIGPNTYIITLTLFEDCGTSFITNSPETINITDDCGYNIGNYQLPIITFQEEVSQLCPSYLDSSECNNGNEPGIYMHVYKSRVRWQRSLRFLFISICVYVPIFV